MRKRNESGFFECGMIATQKSDADLLETQARFVFEKVLGYANHLGLFSEELGPSGEHLGNFPQAFTHLSLISAAYDIDRRLDSAGWGA